MLADFKLENPRTVIKPFLSRQTVYVTDRPFNSYRKAGPLVSTAHEANAVAPKKSLEDPRISGKGDPSSKISPPTLKMPPRGTCPLSSAPTPT